METRLIVVAVEIRPFQHIHRLVIPPDKEADGTLEKVRAYNKCPIVFTEVILRRKL
jgi:hypothetical protein